MAVWWMVVAKCGKMLLGRIGCGKMGKGVSRGKEIAK